MIFGKIILVYIKDDKSVEKNSYNNFIVEINKILKNYNITRSIFCFPNLSLPSFVTR